MHRPNEFGGTPERCSQGGGRWKPTGQHSPGCPAWRTGGEQSTHPDTAAYKQLKGVNRVNPGNKAPGSPWCESLIPLQAGLPSSRARSHNSAAPRGDPSEQPERPQQHRAAPGAAAPQCPSAQSLPSCFGGDYWKNAHSPFYCCVYRALPEAASKNAARWLQSHEQRAFGLLK